MTNKRPNILLILTDQLRHSTAYETNEIRDFRRKTLVAEQGLRDTGVTFEHHYTMSAACTPSRGSLFTGQYPSLHGITQTDGIAKDADGPEMKWLEPGTVPTMGHWFRAGGYRTFYKGKWHVSHAHIPGPDGGYLQTLDDKGNVNAENVAKYLEADILDPYGFSEWVGPEAHGLGKQNTGTARDPFTADETIALIRRLDAEESDQPWLSVCSFLNPHDIALFGLMAKAQGLKFDTNEIPAIPDAPTFKEDLSTKPSAQQSYVDTWGKMLMPQPWVEIQRKYYYRLQLTVDQQIERVLDTLKASGQYENTIVIFSSDHGDMLGAHGGMHQKWHNAYEETVHIPFVFAGPPIKGGGRGIDIPTSHADLIPTMMGLAGIDPEEALKTVSTTHKEAHPLVGRDLSGEILGTGTVPSEPILFTTDDEISEGNAKPGSPLQRLARKVGMYEPVKQPNHIESVVANVEVDGSQHLVKYTRYYDNQQFWTEPGVSDERLHKRTGLLKPATIETVTAPEPDEYELYDLTVDPMEAVNLAYVGNTSERASALRKTMHAVLLDQLAKKRLVPAEGSLPGYVPPTADVSAF